MPPVLKFYTLYALLHNGSAEILYRTFAIYEGSLHRACKELSWHLAMGLIRRIIGHIIRPASVFYLGCVKLSRSISISNYSDESLLNDGNTANTWYSQPFQTALSKTPPLIWQ